MEGYLSHFAHSIINEKLGSKYWKHYVFDETSQTTPNISNKIIDPTPEILDRESYGKLWEITGKITENYRKLREVTGDKGKVAKSLP